MTDTQIKTLKDALSKDSGKDTRAYKLQLTILNGFKKGDK